jgi:hypothetical protein
MFYKLQSSAYYLYEMLIVIISCVIVMKIVKIVWNIFYVLYCLFVAKMERWESNPGKFPFVHQQYLFAETFLLDAVSHVTYG